MTIRNRYGDILQRSRIDIDTVTIATGSADIPTSQASSLRKMAEAIEQVLRKEPSETFLIEGHTDAVGSDDSNLVLSDRRAESVAVFVRAGGKSGRYLLRASALQAIGPAGRRLSQRARLSALALRLHE